MDNDLEEPQKAKEPRHPKLQDQKSKARIGKRSRRESKPRRRQRPTKLK
jgi:hypothetical protein